MKSSHLEKFEVVISDSSFEDDEVEKEVLKQIGAKVKFFQCRSEEEIATVAREADALLNDHLPLSGKTLSSLDKVRIIVRCAIGYDNIDLEKATEKRIIVCNVPDYCINEVADHTLSLILALARKIPWINAATKAGEWNWRRFAPMYRLEGKTAGIIGFGRIGREVAKRLKAFGLRVIAFDPYLPREVFESIGAVQVGLEELLSEADIISVHCPLTRETYHLIDREKFRLMKKTAIFVNVARGAIVDEKALYQALKKKQIQAAGLDVFETEPLEKDNPLLELDNVILTPHIAWYSEEAEIAVRKSAAEEIVRFFSGVKPKNVVNPQVLKWYPELKEA